MFRGIEFIIEYIDDLLIITKSEWYDHRNQLEIVLKNMRANELKCNI